MGNGFEKQVYDAVCMAMGAAVWELVSTGEQLTQDDIARMILMHSEHGYDLVASIALSVLLQA